MVELRETRPDQSRKAASLLSAEVHARQEHRAQAFIQLKDGLHAAEQAAARAAGAFLAGVDVHADEIDNLRIYRGLAVLRVQLYGARIKIRNLFRPELNGLTQVLRLLDKQRHRHHVVLCMFCLGSANLAKHSSPCSRHDRIMVNFPLLEDHITAQRACQPRCIDTLMLEFAHFHVRGGVLLRRLVVLGDRVVLRWHKAWERFHGARARRPSSDEARLALVVGGWGHSRGHIDELQAGYCTASISVTARTPSQEV